MTELRKISFLVYGEARPQGSKRSVAIYRGGKPVMHQGRVMTRVINDNPHLGDWRQQVATEAVLKWGGIPLARTVPVRLFLTFYRPRPASHFGTGKNLEKLKPSAPPYPTTKPDTVKLARAVEDALTGIVWTDDSQVVEHVLQKRWHAGHMVRVTVEELSNEPETDQ